MAILRKIVEAKAFQFTIFESSLHMRAFPTMDYRAAQEDQQARALLIELPDLSLRKIELLLAGTELNGEVLETDKLFISTYNLRLGDDYGLMGENFELTPGQWLVSDPFSGTGYSVVDDDDVKAGNF